MDFKDKIFQLRMQLNMSQENLARELNVSFATINRWEKGGSVPRPQKIYAFEKYCENKNITWKEPHA